MSLKELLHVPIEVDLESYHEQVDRILEIIKPTWKKDTIEITKLTKGYINLLLRCSGGNGNEKIIGNEQKDLGNRNEEEVIVRVFGKTQKFDRQVEVQIMRVLHHENLIEQLYCSFDNGVVYNFAPGETLSRKQLEDSNIRKGIAEKLHHLHKVDIESFIGPIQKTTIIDRMRGRWDKIKARDYTDIEHSERYKEVFPPLKELGDVIDDLQAILDELNAIFPVTWCHTDCHVHNIIYDQITGKVTLVDWESLLWGPEVLDCAVLFDRNVELADHVFSGPEHRQQWIETYLSTRRFEESVSPEVVNFQDTASSPQEIVPSSQEMPSSASKLVPSPQETVSTQMMDLWYRGSLKGSLLSTFNIMVFLLDGIKGSPLKADFLGLAIYIYKKFQQYSRELKELEQISD